MRPRHLIVPLLVLALIGFAGAATGCGEEEHAEAKEGEPLDLGDLAFNIQITRELNRFSPEDSAYLEGAPELGHGEEYLGVFMQITNEGDEETEVPEGFRIVDTRDTVYDQVDLDNEWALRPGTPIPSGVTIPAPETPARSGPIEGSLILFVISEAANENRPLILEVPGSEESGEIVLDL